MIPIDVICYYDLYRRTSWPKTLLCAPQVGHHIQPNDARLPPLQIFKVIHHETFVRLVVKTEDGKVPL